MLKDNINNDIEKTFFNVGEFADEVVINNQTVKVVEDSDKLQYRIKKDYDGLIIGDVLFYISTTDFNSIPKVKPEPYQSLVYKGVQSTITSIHEVMGAYEVILQYSR